MPVVAKARPLGQPAWVQTPPGSLLYGPGQVHDLSVSQLSHLETGDPRSAHFTVGGGMDEPRFHSERTDQSLVQGQAPRKMPPFTLI